MRYFKNSELVRLYNVSDKTVRNWISAAQAGKVELDLFTTEAGKTFVADTLNNIPVLDTLTEHGKKYRNQRSHQSLSPLPEFYELFTPKQQVDIIAELEVHREIPLQYTYIGEQAASLWAAYANRLAGVTTPNILQQTVDLLYFDEAYISSLIKDYSYVNVVDMTLGNALPAKNFLKYIHHTGKLQRYIGIDISQAMLDIAGENVSKWFNYDIRLEKHIKNITHERFSEVLAQDSFGQESSHTINIVLFLGGTITNFREPDQVLQTISNSMGKNDLLITSTKLDSESARRFFDYNIDPNKITTLASQDRHLMRLLNIDESLYTIEQFYDGQAQARIVRFVLKKDISINFEVGAFKKRLDLQKGEKITIFRAQHFSPYELIELYRRNGLGLVQAVTSENQEYMLMISRIVSDITR